MRSFLAGKALAPQPYCCNLRKQAYLQLNSLALLCCLLLRFSPELSVSGAEVKQAPPVAVNSCGRMNEMYKDDAAARLALAELKDTKHLYAIGPLSKLRGEIIIWDSQPFESRVNRGHVQVKSDWGESAAFLVWASVKKWRRITIPPAVRSPDLLDSWLDSMSGKPGFPLRNEYPFLIKGKFARVAWHIVNVQDDGTTLTPEKHQSQKFHGQFKYLNAVMVGFYAPERQGEFIPKGRHTHMHVMVKPDLVAHVDDFDPVADGLITLYVPGQ